MNKQILLFFVGADMCGKTHIAREFCSRTRVPYFKASSEHANFLKTPERFLLNTRYADTRMLDMLTQSGHSLVLDRAYPCEWVYSQFFSRECDLDTIRFLDEGYAALGAKIILCRRRNFHGITDDLDSRLDSSALVKVDSLYEQFVREFTECQVLELWVDDEDLNREVSVILKFCYN